jgi:hypothetical protein
MLGLEFSTENRKSVKTKFAATELEDGTRVTNDKEGDFELGDKVYVIAEDGTLSPAPAGEHTLRDGFVIVVDEEGTLIEIRVPQSEDVADVVEDNYETEEETTEGEITETDIEEDLEIIKETNVEILKVLEEVVKSTDEAIENLVKEVNELKEEVETFKSAPQMTGINERKPVTQSFAEMRLEMLKKHIK